MIKNFPIRPLSQLFLPSGRFNPIIRSVPQKAWFSSSSKQDPTNSSQKFSDLPIAPKLKQALIKNSFNSLTDIQNLAVPSLLQGKNALLQAETGSGKTLCYIVPILNDILTMISKGNPTQREPKGALVLAPNKELCAQIYQFFKVLDPEDAVRITRLGSFNNLPPQIYSLEKDKENKNKKEEDDKQDSATMIEWSNLDVLISTPVQFKNLLKIKDARDPYDINPKFIVVDEYDLLIGDNTLAKSTKSVLERFSKKNIPRQYVLCGASAPKKIGSLNLKEEVESWFPKLEVFQTKGFHRLPEHIKYEYIELPKDIAEEKELLMLKKLLSMSQAKKILIFCNSGDKVNTVCDFLTEREVSCIGFSASMPNEERTEALKRYVEEDIKILVCTDIASRGIDFKDVEHVIQFEYGKNATTVLHRAGRTGRCGKQGTFTSFIREQDELLASTINQIVQRKEGFEGAFSHKRSLRKNERARLKEGEVVEEEEEDREEESYIRVKKTEEKRRRR